LTDVSEVLTAYIIREMRALAMMMEAVSTSEAPLFYETTWH